MARFKLLITTSSEMYLKIRGCSHCSKANAKVNSKANFCMTGISNGSCFGFRGTGGSYRYPFFYYAPVFS